MDAGFDGGWMQSVMVDGCRLMVDGCRVMMDGCRV